MPDIEGVPYEAAGTALDVATAQALAARHREAISAGVAAGTEAKALAQSVVAEVGTIRTAVAQSANSASAAAGSAAQAEQTAEDLVPRVEHIETMAGLAPGEVTDAQTANLISRADTSTRDALNAATAQTVWDVPQPTGTMEGDKALVLAACQKAQAEGRATVTMGPGHYQLDGLTVADVLDRRLHGDGVTFTWQSNVYPFSSEDTAALAGNRGRHGGRGRIAIEVDDALPEHWRYLFPACKRLGITVGTAWHTDNGAQWIAEAYRHGWEVIAHMPENTTAVDRLAAGTLDAAAVSCLDKIEAQIGTREGIGWVYPQHVRSDETDRVLSKYFTRGRGLGEFVIYPRETGHPWYTAAYALDPQFTGGTMSETLKEMLRQVATLDGQAVFYMHLHNGNYTTQLSALTEMVEWCRLLGIDIVNPGQIWADRNILSDPYMEKGHWTASGASGSIDTTTGYHGSRAFKVTPSVGGGFLSGRMVAVQSRPGMFGVYRASFRYKLAQDTTTTSAGQGFIWNAAIRHRSISGPVSASSPAVGASQPFPVSGTTLPAADWSRVQTLVYLPPSATHVQPFLSVQNVSTSSGPILVDELKWEHLDWVAEVAYTGTLVGTGNSIVRTGIPGVANHSIRVVTDTPSAGTVYVSSAFGSTVIVKSTNAADTMGFKVIISPGPSYGSLELPSTGA